MRRRALLLIVPLSCAALAPTTRPDAPALVAALADPDPATRARAARDLRELGPTARDALQAATADPDPEVRTRAAALLDALPLARPGDPPSVRELLKQLQDLDPALRVAFVEEDLPSNNRRDPAIPAVLRRILSDAVAEDVRWAAARVLRARQDGAATQRSLREMETTADNLPLLVTVGWSWMGRDTARSLGLLRRAADLAAARGAPPDAEVLAVFRTLIDGAIEARRYDDAARLLRQLQSLTGPPAYPAQAAATPGVELLALHADFGPFPSLPRDLASLRPAEAVAPTALYSAARLLQRARQPLLAEAVAIVAGRAGDASSFGRSVVGHFLYARRWDRWARREALATLASGGPTMPGEMDLRLAALAADRGDHLDAAEHVERAIALAPEAGGQLLRTDRAGRARRVTPDALRAEAAVHRLRAAIAAGDAKGVAARLDELLILPLDDVDLVSELLPVMRRNGRNDEADRLFEQMYADYKQALDADPDSPEANNNLAWLCARSGERPAEADVLAAKAIAIDKDKSAYLDTAAEAKFRLGQFDEAIALERRALDSSPDDAFMLSQLARFERAKRRQEAGRAP